MLTFRLINTLGEKVWTLIISPTSYGLKIITAILLQRQLWHSIAHQDWYSIKQRNQPKIFIILKNKYLMLISNFWWNVFKPLFLVVRYDLNITKSSWYAHSGSIMCVNQYLKKKGFFFLFLVCLFFFKHDFTFIHCILRIRVTKFFLNL